MLYVECPDENPFPESTTLFLAGGITGCQDWQSKMAYLLRNTELTILNPRRKNFDVSNPSMTEQQIAWEYKHLADANAISFWFEPDQIQPICLFELGRWSMQPKTLFIGCDPNYPRINDVLIQMRLVRPGLQVVNDLRSLAMQIVDYDTLIRAAK